MDAYTFVNAIFQSLNRSAKNRKNKIEKIIAARGTYHLNNLVYKIWYQSAHKDDTNKHLGISTPIKM